MAVRLADLASACGFLWDATRGYRLRPWASPYLRWRIETFWGIPADQIDRAGFLRFSWAERRRLGAFLIWAGRMRRQSR